MTARADCPIAHRLLLREDDDDAGAAAAAPLDRPRGSEEPGEPLQTCHAATGRGTGTACCPSARAALLQPQGGPALCLEPGLPPALSCPVLRVSARRTPARRSPLLTLRSPPSRARGRATEEHAVRHPGRNSTTG
eukprot:scaffold6428_cov332-Prasinococcus_capsulatus_cf.AAC.4